MDSLKGLILSGGARDAVASDHPRRPSSWCLNGRMESSLLGRDVHITRCHRQPRAYRFMVGDHSEIEML